MCLKQDDSFQVEIVNAFEGKDGLKAFREWVLTPDKDILEEAQRVGRKGKGPKMKAETSDTAGKHSSASTTVISSNMNTLKCP